MTPMTLENSKVLDLVDFVEEKKAVTAQEVAVAFSADARKAAALLNSLPFDKGSNLGVYTLPGTVTVEDLLQKIDDPDQLLSDRLAHPTMLIEDQMASLSQQLVTAMEMLKKVLETKTDIQSATGKRRRRRGELFTLTPMDTEALATMRRDALVEVHKAKASGDLNEYRKVYARWNQRIDAQERKLEIGIYSKAEEQCVEESEASDGAQ